MSASVLQLLQAVQSAPTDASDGRRSAVTNRLWEFADIAALVEAADPKPGKRGPYKKRQS